MDGTGQGCCRCHVGWLEVEGADSRVLQARACWGWVIMASHREREGERGADGPYRLTVW